MGPVRLESVTIRDDREQFDGIAVGREPRGFRRSSSVDNRANKSDRGAPVMEVSMIVSCFKLFRAAKLDGKDPVKRSLKIVRNLRCPMEDKSGNGTLGLPLAPYMSWRTLGSVEIANGKLERVFDTSSLRMEERRQIQTSELRQ